MREVRLERYTSGMARLGLLVVWLAVGLCHSQPVSRPLDGFPLTRESKHFCLYWDDLGTLPMEQADSGLARLEAWWDFQIGGDRFPNPDTGLAHPRRTCVFLLEAGWSLGGLDAGWPSLWFAPKALQDNWALGHEFMRSLQARTGGFQENPYVAWFLDSHANWMNHQRYPQYTHCSELYAHQQHAYFGSTRNRYCNWPFLEFLKERTGGYAVIDSLWTGWSRWNDRAALDVPAAFARQLGLSEAGFSDLWGEFALHMARADFVRGAVYRRDWEYLHAAQWQRLRFPELEAIDTALGRYRIPFEVAPQRLGFNVVPIHPGVAGDTVRLSFRGISQNAPAEAWRPLTRLDPDTVGSAGSDWRWGVAIVDTAASGGFSFRYLGPFPAGVEMTRFVLGTTEHAYLVVAATPTESQPIAWDRSYRSIYRYPWMLEVRGARPEGYQPGRGLPVGSLGARHPNGGGWVAYGATVDSTAWVGPEAMVLEEAKVLGRARIEGRAVAMGTSTVRDQAVLRGAARTWGDAVVRDRAVVAGHAVVCAGEILESALVDGYATVDVAGSRVGGSAHLGGTAFLTGSVDLGGTAVVTGDAELQPLQLRSGSFSGYVDAAAIRETSLGAGLSGDLPEVTRRPSDDWERGVGIGTRRSQRQDLSLRRVSDGIVVAGLAGRSVVSRADLQGRTLERRACGPEDGECRLGLGRAGLECVKVEDGAGVRVLKVVMP